MLFGQIEHERPLPGDTQQMNPNKIVKDPAGGWRLGRFAFLVGKRGSMVALQEGTWGFLPNLPNMPCTAYLGIC